MVTDKLVMIVMAMTAMKAMLNANGDSNRRGDSQSQENERDGK